jgi:MSHA biogenesis protein MshJ
MKLGVKVPPAMRRLGARIDALSLRERAILFISLLAALFLVADQLLFPAQRRVQQQLEQQINSQLAQLSTINGQIERIVRENIDDPDALLRTRLEILRKQYAELELSAGDITRGLVSPREMTRLVYAMLRENRGLQLVKAENLPPEAIPLAVGAGAPLSADGAGPAVYRHGLRLQVKGRYPDIVRYLHTLENLNWRVMWGEVRLETSNYPATYATLTIYTLSLDKGWIGV